MGMGISKEIDFARFERMMSPPSLEFARYMMANEMLKSMTKHVPKKRGTLRQAGHVSSDGKELVWRMVYARAQFHGSRPWRRGMPINVFMKKYTKPNTGARWDQMAKENPRNVKAWRRAWVRSLKR